MMHIVFIALALTAPLQFVLIPPPEPPQQAVQKFRLESLAIQKPEKPEFQLDDYTSVGRIQLLRRPDRDNIRPPWGGSGYGATITIPFE